MEMTIILIFLGVIFMVVALIYLYWAVRTKQFNNLDVEANRIIFEDKYHD